MRTFHLICYIIAALAFLFAFLASSVSDGSEATSIARKANLVALGLLAWVTVPLSNVIDDIAD